MRLRSDCNQRFIDVCIELSFGDSYCAGCEDTAVLAHRTAVTFLVGNHRHGRDCSITSLRQVNKQLIRWKKFAGCTSNKRRAQMSNTVADLFNVRSHNPSFFRSKRAQFTKVLSSTFAFLSICTSRRRKWSNSSASVYLKFSGTTRLR